MEQHDSLVWGSLRLAPIKIIKLANFYLFYCVDYILIDTIWVVIKVEHGGILGITQQMSTFATTTEVN